MTPKRNLDFSKEVVTRVDPPAMSDEACESLEGKLGSVVADDSAAELTNLRTIIVSLAAKLKA